MKRGLLLLLMLIFALSASAQSNIGESGNTSDQNILLDLGLDAFIWQGFTGNYTPQLNDNTTTFQGNVTSVSDKNIKIGLCFDSNLFAAPAPTINWSNIAIGDFPTLDSFISVGPTSTFRAAKVFTDSETFEVNGANLTIPTANLNPPSSLIKMGLLKDGTTPIFVVDPKNNLTNFENKTANYQYMLPSPLNESTTYYFFTDPSIDCRSPRIENISNITAFEGDNITINTSTIYDPNQNPLTFNFSIPFNETGEWATTFFDSGVYEIEIEACDPGNNCATKKINVTVLDVPICGDFFCGINESCSSCKVDCGPCSSGGGGGSESSGGRGGGPGPKLTSDLEERISKVLLHLEKKDLDENILSLNKKIEERRTLQNLIVDVRALILSRDSIEERRAKLDELEIAFANSISDIPKEIELKSRESLSIEKVIIAEVNETNTRLEKDFLETKTFSDNQLSDWKILDKQSNILEFDSLNAVYGVSYFDDSKTNLTTTVIRITPLEDVKNLNISITLPNNIDVNQIPHIGNKFAQIIKENDQTILHFTNLNFERGDEEIVLIQSKGVVATSNLQGIRILAAYTESTATLQSAILTRYTEIYLIPFILAFIGLIIFMILWATKKQKPFIYLSFKKRKK